MIINSKIKIELKISQMDPATYGEVAALIEGLKNIKAKWPKEDQVIINFSDIESYELFKHAMPLGNWEEG